MNLLVHRHRQRVAALYDFVTCAAELLASDDEAHRRQLESRLLTLLPEVQATPAWDIFAIRNPALRNMLADSAAPPRLNP